MTRWANFLAGLALGASLVAGGALRAQGGKPGTPGFTYGDLKNVTLQGKLIALPDELGRLYGAKTAGAGERQYGLQLPDGTLYTFLDNAKYRQLTDGEKLKGKPVEVQARQFPRSLLLEVEKFRELPADALKRTYFCKVCVITSYEPGPCVCCGAEVELVTAKPAGAK